MSFKVFAFLRALSVTYTASASRDNYESRQGNAPKEETTETPVLREYVTSCDGADRNVRTCRIGCAFLSGEGFPTAIRRCILCGIVHVIRMNVHNADVRTFFGAARVRLTDLR